ncbi:MAG: winged helix-turn-helix domain-containing protein [Terriglobales bacterium]|jgi:DNA-binding winged helix-turn-helix (wHTH) protein/tetratricopeptide (TPR) repeat protein
MSLSSIPLPSELQPVVRFGLFEADLRAGELRKSGVKVKIQDLPFRALTLLLSRPNEVISRKDFRQYLWPQDVFVDFDRGISSAIKRLRDALGDSPENPIFIETIDRRGYRWIGPVHLPEPFSDEMQEKESPEKPATPAAAPLGAEHSPWRWKKMVFALPVLAILFGLWLFRPGFREAKMNPKSVSASAQGPHQPANREAEELYLKGRFYWNKRTPDSLNQALEAFTQAIAHDPNYSDAYVGLADSYNLLREFSAMPGNEAYFQAFAAAKKAVELDQQSSEAHASLAFVTFFGMWDAADAEKEFRRAIQLDPNNAKAHHWYATFLNTNRQDEALAEIDLARKLMPDSSSILADKGVLLWDAGHREEALRLLQQLETTEPDFVSPHRYLRMAYLDTGDYSNYIAELKKEALLTHDAALSAVAEAAAKGFAQSGERGLLQAEFSEQMKLYEQRKLSPYFLAQTEARLGNRREALRHLTICVESHDELMLDLPNDQSFASLHGDAAFEQLLGKAGLPRIN